MRRYMENVMDDGQTGGSPQSLTRAFQLRLMELAKQGRFGSLRTRKESLQRAWQQMLALLDAPHIPILVYGEKGSGKRRLADEYFAMHTFHKRIEGVPHAKFRVFRGDFVSEGFCAQLQEPATKSDDFVYIEGVDLLSPQCQLELLNHLRLRKQWVDKGLAVPRLMLGTERSLSLLSMRGLFDRDLFQAITGFAVFVPTVQDRPEDTVHLVQTLAQEMTGRVQTPPAWLVDAVASRPWENNVDELKRFLQNGLARNPQLSSWQRADFAPAFRATAAKAEATGTHGFDATPPRDATGYVKEREQIQQALLAHAGDRSAAALSLGISRTQLLQRLMIMGVR